MWRTSWDWWIRRRRARRYPTANEAVTLARNDGSESAKKAVSKPRNIQLGVVLWDGKHLSKLVKAARGQEPAEEKLVRQRKKASTGKGSAAVKGDIAELAADAGLEAIDKRDIGGCLWVIGGPGIEKTLQSLGDEALGFTYKPGGGKATGGRDAWWVK